MRVTNTSTMRNLNASVNEAHRRLNKSMSKISSGAAYESAAENPLAYYEGKRIDAQYQDVVSKLALASDVKNRLYQQELGARDIQKQLADAKNQIQYAQSDTSSSDTTLDTIRQDLLQTMHSMVDTLNSQYQNFYIFGGNDLSTPPFSLSSDGKELTFSHVYPGDSKATSIKMSLVKNEEDGAYAFRITEITNPDGSKVPDGDLASKGEELLRKAMSEQGRVDIGYGSSDNADTLLDTYTGGFNVLTGLSSSAIIADAEHKINIMDTINSSALTLVGSASMAISDYINRPEGTDRDEAKAALSAVLGNSIDAMTDAEHRISSSYTDLGSKSSLIEDTESKLTIMKQSLTEQYTNIMGADPYESIMEWYNNQNSYNAALRVGAQLFSSSLFDFMR